MVILARFVKEESFGLIVDVRLPETEVLRDEHSRVCPILRRPGAMTKQVLEVLDRWSIPADGLRDDPLSAAQALMEDKSTSYSLLDGLYSIMQEFICIQWVSENPAEPAVFWDSSLARSSSRC